MLGLGGDLMSGGYIGDTLLASYVSDFTSDADGWSAYSVEGTLTLAGGQTAPGSSATGEWLKGTFDTTQTSGSGIQIANFGPTGLTTGDYLVITYDVYLLDDSGKWDPEGDSDPVSHRVAIMGIASTTLVDLDTLTSAGPLTLTSTGGAQRTLILEVSTADDRPQAGAVFYIKSIVATLYRPL